jgi:hypothetical protein
MSVRGFPFRIERTVALPILSRLAADPRVARGEPIMLSSIPARRPLSFSLANIFLKRNSEILLTAMFVAFDFAWTTTTAN